MMRVLQRALLCLLLISLVFCAVPLRSYAAGTAAFDEIYYDAKIYDRNSGLPFSEANLTLQTPDGFVYIGAYGGLIRYDGRKFETVEGVSSAISLFSDSRGRLWAGTNESGAVCIDHGTATVYGTGEGLPSSSVCGFHEYENGDILIATRSGLACLDASGTIHVLRDSAVDNVNFAQLCGAGPGKVYARSQKGDIFLLQGEKVLNKWKADVFGTDISTIYPDPDAEGMVYLGTEGSEVLYGSLDDALSKFIHCDISSLSGVNCLRKGGNLLWVCADNGAGYIDQDGTFTPLRHMPVRNAYEHVTIDREGNLWFSSSRRGVMKLSRSLFADVSIKAGLNEVVNATWEQDGLLYVGTDSGLTVLDSDYYRVETPLSELLAGARIRSILGDSSGRLWICTYSEYGLVCADPKAGTYRSFTTADGLPSGRVRDAIELRDGRIAVSVLGGVCLFKDGEFAACYGTREGLNNSTILCLCEASDGTLYLGSNGDGIYILRDGKLEHLDCESELSNDVVLRILEDPKRGCILVVSGGGEVGMLEDGRIRMFRNLPDANHSGSPYYDILLGRDGTLWLLGGSGICAVDGDALIAGDQPASVVYNKKNGLPHISTSNSRSYLSSDGVAYLAGNDGVTRIDISEREGVTGDPLIAIPFIEVDGERVWLEDGETVTIPQDARRVIIDAHVLTYAMDDPTVRYQLAGFDKDALTVPLSELPQISYTNLRGGNYIFRIETDGGDANSNGFRFALEKEKKLYEKTEVRIAIAGLVLLLAALVINDILKRQKRRLEAKAEEERLNGELNMASSIQANLLPGVFPAFPDRSEFDVFASMTPAREVGGDFYDFFLIDSDHLALVIGDVNGKGVPAALFMTLTKTLIKSTAMAYESPARVLDEVNGKLSEDMEKSMFVTVWLGILQISTGTLVWADGGSRKPVLRREGSWRMLPKHTGTALCLVDPEQLKGEEAPVFADQTLSMEPGELLFLYTDGVTDSSDSGRKLFGEERLLDSLGQTADNASPEDMIASVKACVDAFAVDAPQNDDITMLCLRYNGK